MFESITVIAFDLDDTLWPCMPTINRAEQASYEFLKANYPRITDSMTEQDMLDYRKHFMRSNPHLKVDLSQMRREMLAALARQYDYEESPLVEQGFELFYRLRHDVTFYDDVFPVLDRLQQHYRLGSISNGNASAGLTALNDYFHYFINAHDVLVAKPDKKIFDAFCHQLEISPQQCLLVGDDPVHDVLGGQNAGMKTLWVNRHQTEWPESMTPADAEINTLHQLLDLLPLPTE